MKWLFSSLTAAVVIPALFIGTQPATAGLGAADTEVVKEFDAWCGKRKNNCKVSFPSSTELRVNDKDGITRDQLQSVRCDAAWRQMGLSGIDHWEYYWLLKYREDETDKSGKFLFVNTGAYSDFVDAVLVFCGPKCRPVGPSIKIENE